jgi:hypothetical protein
MVIMVVIMIFDDDNNNNNNSEPQKVSKVTGFMLDAGFNPRGRLFGQLIL